MTTERPEGADSGSQFGWTAEHGAVIGTCGQPNDLRAGIVRRRESRFRPKQSWQRTSTASAERVDVGVLCVCVAGGRGCWDAHDCGTAVNPLAVEGQVEGAVVMGMSETLLENQVFDDNGKILNADLHNYLMATSMDAPTIDSSIVDSYEPEGPYGAKEVGEGATLPVLGAIANAVADATCVRIYELPITPEKVLRGLKGKNGLP